MSSNLFYATICLLIGVITFFFWWHEMFSDGPVGEFSRSFDSDRGKNFIALTIPAIGTSLISGSVLAFFLEITSPSPSQSRHPNILYSVLSSLLGAVGILSLLLFIVSFIPFSLPEWMYPEYHAAKREAAERGEAEGRFPFLDDDGVYASQLGNVPVDIPEPVGLPSAADPHSPQTAPAPGSPPAPHGSPEAGAPTLHGPDAAPTPHAGTADAFDTTAIVASLPRTGAPTSHGARPTRARRSPQEGDATPTTDNATDEPDNTDETEHSSAPSEAPSASPQAQPSEESLVRSSEGSQGAGLMESQRELSTGAEDAVESAFAFYHYPKEGR